MLLTDCNVVIIGLVLLYGLYKLCNTYKKTTLRRAAGSLCNSCPHSKIVQLNKINNIHFPKDSFTQIAERYYILLSVAVCKHAILKYQSSEFFLLKK